MLDIYSKAFSLVYQRDKLDIDIEERISEVKTTFPGSVPESLGDKACND